MTVLATFERPSLSDGSIGKQPGDWRQWSRASLQPLTIVFGRVSLSTTSLAPFRSLAMITRRLHAPSPTGLVVEAAASLTILPVGFWSPALLRRRLGSSESHRRAWSL